MTRYRSLIPFEFEADNDDQADERMAEIWSAVDWSLVPTEYGVSIEDCVDCKRVPPTPTLPGTE